MEKQRSTLEQSLTSHRDTQYWGLFSIVTGLLEKNLKTNQLYVFTSRQAARDCKKTLGKSSNMVEVDRVWITDMAPSAGDEDWWG